MEIAYLVVPFIGEKLKGKKAVIQPKAEPAFQCYSRDDASRRAERVAERDKYVGAIAVSQEYDKETGELGKYEEISRFGMVPEELLE